MHIKILTPDHVIFEGEVDSVLLPGVKGEFHIMKNHAAIVSALVGGKIRVFTSAIDEKYSKYFHQEHAATTSFSYDCLGGVVEFNNNKGIILCE